MDDQRVGRVVRAVRLKRRWRQADLAAAAAVSRSTVSRLERGHLDGLSVRALRRCANALEIRFESKLDWRGGELDALQSRGHSLMQEQIAERLGGLGWALVPEASFSYYGERGVVDLLAFHPARSMLLVVEVKTAIVDVPELLGTLDRKRRLAVRVARDKGWRPTATSCWLAIADGRTNRRRVAAHYELLRAALPDDGRGLRAWLRDPQRSAAFLGFLPHARPWSTRPRSGSAGGAIADS